MTGVEVLAAAAVAYLVRKAGRVGRRADVEVDRVLDEGMDRLHELIGEKLDGDPVLERLEEQAQAGNVAERTERRVADAIADAAEADEDFASRLQELVEALQQRDTPGGGGAGSVSNVISGGTQYGPVLQGRDFGTVNLGTSSSPPAGGEDVEGKGPRPAR